MYIEKTGNKWRITEMRNGTRYRVSVDHKPSKREAEDLMREKINQTDPTGDVNDTFEVSARKYILIRSNVISPSTIRGYNGIIKALSDNFKQTKLSNISQELIQKEINDYSATHSPKSTRNLHGFISAVLATYRPQMVIRTTLPQKNKFEPYTPTEDDIKHILKDVAGTKYEIAYRLGCYGLRRGEICAITKKDIQGNMLYINKSKVLNEKGEWVIKPMPKTTESNREIYIDDELRDLILKQGTAYTEHPERLSKHLKIICRDHNIPSFRFHDLRAYYASMAHALGVPDAYIMANGGWSSPTIMNRVYKRTFSDKQAAFNKSISEKLKP